RYPVNADRPKTPKTRLGCRRSVQISIGAQSASRFRAASTTTLPRHRTEVLPETGQRDFESAAEVVRVFGNPSTTRSSESRMIAEAAAKRLSATTSGDHGRTSAAKRLLHAFGPTHATRHPKARPVCTSRGLSPTIHAVLGRTPRSSSAAIDNAVAVEEDRRLIDGLRTFGQSMTLHTQRPS